MMHSVVYNIATSVPVNMLSENLYVHRKICHIITYTHHLFAAIARLTTVCFEGGSIADVTRATYKLTSNFL